MNIICDSKRLFQGLTVIDRVISPNYSGTVYATIEAKDGKAILRTTNQAQMALCDLKAQVLKDGICHLPAWRMVKFTQIQNNELYIKSLPPKQVEITDQFADFDIKLTTPNLTPVPIPPTGEATIKMPADIRTSITYAMQCAATDESRPILTGVLFQQKDNVLHMVSADGFRLMEVARPLEAPDFNIIIPHNALSLVCKLEGDLTFGYNRERAWFDTDGIRLISELLQGTFPMYQQLIPSAKPAWKVTVPAWLLNQRLNQLSSETPSGIARIEPKGNTLRLSTYSEDEDEEECSILIPAKMEGEGRIAFNRKYMIETSKIFSEMTLEVTIPSAPIKIYGDLDGVTMVMMPMFVQW